MSLAACLFRPVPPPTLAERAAPLAAPAALEGGWRIADPTRLRPTAERPVVSVVTVCFNSAKTIADTIAGVRRQTYAPIEYVIVDGGSTDGTVDVIRANEDVVAYWRSERDGGIYDAFNKGIALARGECIQIINSDDWMEPDQVERAVSALQRTGADFVHGDIVLHGWRGQDVRIGGDPHWDLRVRRTMPSLHQATVLARRRVYERVGLFRTDLRIASDYDWFIRVARAGLVGAHDPTILAHMRAGGASTTRQRRTIAEGFICARTNGDELLPCLWHWSGRWIWPNGVPGYARRCAGAVRGMARVARGARSACRRAAMRVANAAPVLRSVPGKAMVKRAIGLRDAVETTTTPGQARLADFVDVRDLDGGLSEAAIVELLELAPRIRRVRCSRATPIARQAWRALELGGATCIDAARPDEARVAQCDAALVDAQEAQLREWTRFPILVEVRPTGIRVASDRR
ncbi:MAG: glycosyltransferase [Phycisphaerae bacterium]|nr:glycosyltransferase [Phycisphaerae bacterium]